ncbi:hypothetical protein ABT034_08180 [Streptomyces sp. NPDC002773]
MGSTFRRSRYLARWTPPAVARRVLLGLALWGARRVLRRVLRRAVHAR